MALAITIPELAVAIRLTSDPTADVLEPELGILTRQHGVAEAMIEQYAPDAPDVAKSEAAVLLVGYIWEMPVGQRNHSNAFRSCGAMALLARWR